MDGVLPSDLLEDGSGDFLTITQLQKKIDQGGRGFGGANVGAKEKSILELIEESDGVIRIAIEGIVSAASGEVAVKVVILAHKFGDGSLGGDRSGGVTTTLGNIVKRRYLGPEGLGMPEELELWEAAE